MKRITVRQARLLSLSQTVYAVFKLCNELAYKEVCTSDFWELEDVSEFKFYI
jgi:hypothetical protein